MHPAVLMSVRVYCPRRDGYFPGRIARTPAYRIAGCDKSSVESQRHASRRGVGEAPRYGTPYHGNFRNIHCYCQLL